MATATLNEHRVISSCEEPQHVAEADELLKLVGSVAETEGSAALDGCPRFDTIVSKYQETPQLLDPLLEGLVSPLAGVLERIAQRLGAPGAAPLTEADLALLQGVCKMLWRLCNVRGHKTVVRFLPNAAMDLEPAASLLEQLHAKEEAGVWVWESLFCVLLWLSMLALIPFSLSTVDTKMGVRTGMAAGAANGGSVVDSSPPPMVASLVSVCQAQLGRPTTVRDVAALLLGKLLTRPDQGAALCCFLPWAQQALEATGPGSQFLVPGAARALAEVFKRGHRHVLLPTAHKLWPLVGPALLASDVASSSLLVRKLAVKLAQRIGLTFLPARVVPWRYQRQLATIKAAAAAEPAASSAAIGSLLTTGGGEGGADGDGDDEYEVCEEVEEVIQVMLTGLQDRDTVVRWSAAKGVARITARLPKDLGDEVVGALLDSFEDTSHDSCWHGACLALAELAQRGLLLPARLPAVVPLVAAALHFDVRRGAHSVGSHVRDAAAYVCWSFGRAYAPDTLAPCVDTLAPALVVAACYDREVNCRRAAAAAFQECVGRLGNFPHGIDIVTSADYFSLSSRSSSYLTVAPAVAAFPEYTDAMVRHLVEVKLQHWERATRELAARGLADLIPHQTQRIAGPVLDSLVRGCTAPVLEARHGCCCALAEVLLGLRRAFGPGQRALEEGLGESRCTQVAGVPGAIADAHMYRGKGGELMRQAACRLIECCSEARLPAPVALLGSWQQVLDGNLGHPADLIQRGAAAALAAFSRTYLVIPDAPPLTQLTLKYCDGLGDLAGGPPMRRGSALALGALPAPLLRGVRHRVINQLCAALQVEDDPEVRDVETRAYSATALAAVCTELYYKRGGGNAGMSNRSSSSSSSRVGGGVAADGSAAIAATPVAANGGGGGGGGKEEAGQAVVVASGGGDGGGINGGMEEPGHAVVDDAELVGELREVVGGQAAGALLRAMEDYSTDSRGDIGSWVREAAMDGLCRLLQILVAGRAASGREAAAAAARAAPVDDGGGDVGNEGADVSLEDELAQRVVAALLKQAVERIGRIREAATRHLRSLCLASSSRRGGWAAFRPLPGLSLLRAAAVDQPPSSMASLEGLPRVVRLVGVPRYRRAVLEGLVASIGGLDAQLSAAAGGALVTALCNQQRQQAEQLDGRGHVGDGGGGSGGGGEGEEEAGGFAVCLMEDLLDLWRSNQRSSRLSTPLLRTAALLLSDTPLCPALRSAGPRGEALLAEVVDLTRAEGRSCRDVARLCAVGAVLAYAAACVPGPAGAQAMQSTMVLLQSRFPKVRHQAAEALYLQLLSADADEIGYSDEQLADAQELLLGSDWDTAGLEEAHATAANLACLLGVQPPKPPKAVAAALGGVGGRQGVVSAAGAPGSSTSAAAAAAASSMAADASLSYQSLIDNLGRGYM